MDQPAVAPDPRVARFARLAPIAVILLLPILLLVWTLRKGGTVYGLDMINGGYHIRSLVGQELSSGRAATWDPHAMCGFPLLAGLQSCVFYPLTWLIVVFGPGTFWTLTVLLHLILVGLFAYGWLKEGLSLSSWAALVGAIVLMLSGYLLTHADAGHITQLSTYPWIAALLWRAERLLVRPTLKRWTLLAGAMTMLILAGFPQFLFFSGLLLFLRFACYAFERRESRALCLRTLGVAGAALIVGALAAAPQLLPTMELIPRSHRVSVNTFEFATSFSLPPENLLMLVAPTFFGGGNSEMYWGRGAVWESCGFVGVGALALTALAFAGRHPQRFLWAGVCGIALLLALGPATPLFKAFYTLVPGAGLFRAPGRYLALFTLGIAALAAMGFDRCWRDPEGARRAMLRTGIGVAALLLAVLGALLLGSRAERGNSPLWRSILAAEEKGRESYSLARLRQRMPNFSEFSYDQARNSLIAAGLSLGGLTVVLLAQGLGFVPGRRGAGIVGVLLTVELALVASRILKTEPDEHRGWPRDFLNLVNGAAEGPCRIASPGLDTAQDVGRSQMAGVDHLGGYESMILASYADLMNVVVGQPPESPTVMAPISGPHPVLDMLGARFWLIRRPTRIPSDWKLRSRIEDARVYESPNAFPRAFLVRKTVPLARRDLRLRVLAGSTADFLKDSVILEKEAPASFLPDKDLGQARILSSRPGFYEIEARTDSGAWLVLTEAHYPGWEAWIDGTPTEIYRANHFVQAIQVPTGTHRIRFAYHSRWLLPGFVLTLLMGAIPAGLALAARRRASPSPSSPGPAQV